MARRQTAIEVWDGVMADYLGTIIGGFFTADEAARMRRALERDEAVKAELRRQMDVLEDIIARMQREREVA